MKFIAVIIITVFGFFYATAQIEEVQATTQGDGTVSGYKYRFTSQVDDTISIKIIDPRGELMTVPVQEHLIQNNQSIPFSFQTRYWREGQYQIIVESKKNPLVVKRLILDRSGKKITN